MSRQGKCTAPSSSSCTAPSPSSWIAPSSVHSTCPSKTSTATTCSALNKVHRTFPLFVDCTFFGAFHVPFEQPATQPGAAHWRKCTAPDFLFVHRPFPLFVDCTFFGAFHVPFEQPAPQPGAAHLRKCNAPDFLFVDCTFFGAFHVPFQHRNQVQRTGESAPHQTSSSCIAPSPSSWIAPSSVHSTCPSSTPTRCSALKKVQRTRLHLHALHLPPLRGLHLLRCIPRALPATHPGAAHWRKCTAPSFIFVDSSLPSLCALLQGR
jgi:hypothetical protein